MATSLFEQLQALKAPHDSALVETKQRASILFDAKEAAGKDPRIIYDLGHSGLQELIMLNSNFKQFETILFDEASFEMERSVENRDVNSRLHMNIKKFLLNLSPYFLLRPVHMCLEWLIYKFQIHKYNQQELLGLILPYNETNIFVLVLRTMQLNKDWLWLKPIQKHGKPLMKTAILSHCSSNQFFYKFICLKTLECITEFSSNAHLLYAQINFFCSVVVGVLENTQKVEEWQITSLLFILLKGLKSPVADFVSAVYIIISQLVIYTQLTKKLNCAFVKRILKITHKELQGSSLLLLNHIFDKQSSNTPEMEMEDVLSFIQKDGLWQQFTQMIKDNIDIMPLLGPLISSCLKALEKNDNNRKIIANFFDELLTLIKFNNIVAPKVISILLDVQMDSFENTNDPPKIQNGEIIELNSDEDDDENNISNFKNWYNDYLNKVQIHCSNAFDDELQKFLNEDSRTSNKIQNHAVSIALSYHLKFANFNGDSLHKSLFHAKPTVRLQSLRVLLSNLRNYRKQNTNTKFLKDYLTYLLNDESPLVVAELLQLPTAVLVDIIGANKLLEGLIRNMYKSQLTQKEWNHLALNLIEHLASELLLEQYDEHLILFAVMPILFPLHSKNFSIEALLNLQNSPLVKRISFLKKLKITKNNFNGCKFKLEFLKVISSNDNRLNIFSLIDTLDGELANHLKNGLQIYYVFLLGTACVREEIACEQSLHIFQRITTYSSDIQIKHLNQNAFKDSKSLLCIPLQLYSDFLTNLLSKTKFQDLPDKAACWEDINIKELSYFLTVYEVVLEHTFSQSADNSMDFIEWCNILKNLLSTVFTSTMKKMEFLINFYIYDTYSYINLKDYQVLRIRSFKLLQMLFKKEAVGQEISLNASQILKISIALKSPLTAIRTGALRTLTTIQRYHGKDMPVDLQLFLKQILKQENEIIMDAEQYPLILYATLQNQKLYGVQKQLLDLLYLCQMENALDINNYEKNDRTVSQPLFKTQLMAILNHINDETTLKSLLPLGIEVLKQTTSNAQGNLEILAWPFSCLFELTCKHLVLPTIKTVLERNYQPAKHFIESVFRRHSIYVKRNDGILKPSVCILLKAIDKEVYEDFPPSYQQEFVYLIVETLAQSENDMIFQTVNKLLKKCSINCKPLVGIIENMYKISAEMDDNPIIQITTTATAAAATTTNEQIAKHLQFNSKTWKQGVILLELLENNKKLQNAEILFDPLFELLTYCLSLEEQVLIEYVKQLIMMVLLNICTATKHLMMAKDNVIQPAYRLDQIVQCLRMSANPQTYYNAFKLLSECASLCPQQVLDNIVEIFTFMGSSLIRNEYTFNVSILNDILASIIPILIQDSSYLVPVIRVFADIMLDVPDHRRLPVYNKLLVTLDAESCLWMFLSVVFESQMKEDEQLVKQHLQYKNMAKPPITELLEETDACENLSTRLQIALDLIYSFPPSIILKTCIQLVIYIKQLSSEQISTRTEGRHRSETELFNLNSYTEKQIQHYQNLIMQFVSIVVNSPPFLRHMAVVEDSELMLLKPLYQDFIIELLSFVPEVHASIEKYQKDTNKEKFWQTMLYHLNDVLDNTVNLLTPDMFLAVVQGLLQHNLLSIRKKIIQLLINKLQQADDDDFFQNFDVEKFRQILILLKSIASEILTSTKQGNTSELQLLQQTALIAIQLMATLFCMDYVEEFNNVLTILAEIVEQRTTNELPHAILATVLLTMIEICCSLKSRCLPHISKIMRQLISVLNEVQKEFETASRNEIYLTDSVCLALVTCLQKLYDSIPAFLGAYMVEIIIALTTISIRLNAKTADKNHRHSIILKYINAIWLQMATGIPLRVVVPKCHRAYQVLISEKCFPNIIELMQLVQYALEKNPTQELFTVEKDFSKIFKEALQFRWFMKENYAGQSNQQEIELVEAKIIGAFLSWILKLSESDFRQFYRRFYDWCLKEVNTKESVLTFFLTTRRVATALKSLFILFASEFVGDLTQFLLQCKSESEIQQDIQESPATTDITGMNSQILAAIFDMLQIIFLHDNEEFVSVQRMQTLVPAIVDQLDNNLVLQNTDLQNLLKQCAAQLATAIHSNVMLLKQFNHQVLLKTRANIPEVRLLAINCCVEIARKLGNDFTVLIPEVVPFIAELMEDENSQVEQNTHKAVQELEAILGESFQKYL